MGIKWKQTFFFWISFSLPLSPILPPFTDYSQQAYQQLQQPVASQTATGQPSTTQTLYQQATAYPTVSSTAYPAVSSTAMGYGAATHMASYSQPAYSMYAPIPPTAPDGTSYAAMSYAAASYATAQDAKSQPTSTTDSTQVRAGCGACVSWAVCVGSSLSLFIIVWFVLSATLSLPPSLSLSPFPRSPLQQPASPSPPTHPQLTRMPLQLLPQLPLLPLPPPPLPIPSKPVPAHSS